MTHKEEIRQIRKMLNLHETGDVSTDNFAKTVYDEEVQDGVAYLEPKVTGLKYGLIIDETENYIIFRHPECVYVVDGDKLIPISMINKPKMYDILPGAANVMDFVNIHQRDLLAVTHDKMTITQLREKIKDEMGVDRDYTAIAEMPFCS